MNKLTAIAKNLTEIVGNVEKSTKTAVQYIKIHETPKSDPMLIGTKRRITLLESEIKKREFEYGYFTYIEFNES